MRVKFTQKQVPEISEKIIKKLLKMDNKRARVLAFSGELGAGKTTLTKELARKFGIKENIISPTFVIMKFYDIDRDSEYYSHFKKLIHIDAYRLDSHEELNKIGWDELVNDKENLIILEWPERVEKCLKEGTCWIKLEHIDEETRSLEF
jgi:tRNA threonylcarbamoyladenosine biosynthesis protein TsaE